MTDDGKQKFKMQNGKCKAQNRNKNSWKTQKQGYTVTDAG